jgi:lipopolysaccharide/colanic/teichoic acid biosynthesis glycosyltransferase
VSPKTTDFGAGRVRPPTKKPPVDRSRFWVSVPKPPTEFAFTLIYRIGMSFIALAFSALPVLVWGGLNGWRLTHEMIAVQAFIVIAIIAVGESLRTAVYARSKEAHDEFSRRMAVEALIAITRAKRSDQRHRAAPPPRQALSKRALDVGFATAALILLAPTLLLIALLIKLDSPGPVLYKQVQLGAGARPFLLYRFRWFPLQETQLRQRPAKQRGQEEAWHVTLVGRLLIATSLAELPALINVLRGEMSLVGPRPLREADRHLVADFQERFLTRPGLTGPWVLWTAGRQELAEYLTHEVDYVRYWSIGLDLRILLRTLSAALTYRH